MTNINIPIAFVAGVFSSLAPCILPLLPVYIGYAAGISLREKKTVLRKKVLLTNFLFILGFSTVFVFLGTAAAGFGMVFRRYDLLIQRLGGLLIIIFGLEFSGYLHIPFLQKSVMFKLPKWANNFGYARSFLIGVIFATAWSPCVGAVLGSILALAAVSGTVYKGAVLLFFYSLGISVPFILMSLFLTSAPKYLKILNSKVELVSKIAGLLLVLLGMMLLTNTYKYVNYWLTGY